MSSEGPHIFDARRTIEHQGFSGGAAATTLHDATETGFQASGIFRAAKDLANVQRFPACGYFHHLRLKPLPLTDLSGHAPAGHGDPARLRHPGPPAHSIAVLWHGPLKTGTLHGILMEVARMRSTTADALAALL